LAGYRRKISELGMRADQMSAKDIAAEVTKSSDVDGVNFAEFCKDHIEKLKKEGRTKTASSLNTVYNSLCDFFKSNNFMASDITSRMLREYEAYLKSKRVMYRSNQSGGTVKITKAPIGNGLFNYMRDLRVLFNGARNEHL
jgi:hypothetical protein